MALQNIGASNSDGVFHMPSMITKIEGHGIGVKTSIVNMVDVAKAMSRPASYITKYFGCENLVPSKFDEITGVSLVDGYHKIEKLAGLLEKFFKTYVQCYGCGNPGTVISISNSQRVQLKCACGFVSDVDMRDRLTSFILENPPKQKNLSNDKKAVRNAYMICLLEGEAADKILKNLKKPVKKTKDGHGNTTTSKKEDNAGEVEWLIDTSAEATLQLIEERRSTADLLTLTSKKVNKNRRFCGSVNAF